MLYQPLCRVEHEPRPPFTTPYTASVWGADDSRAGDASEGAPSGGGWNSTEKNPPSHRLVSDWGESTSRRVGTLQCPRLPWQERRGAGQPVLRLGTSPWIGDFSLSRELLPHRPFDGQVDGQQHRGPPQAGPPWLPGWPAPSTKLILLYRVYGVRDDTRLGPTETQAAPNDWLPGWPALYAKLLCIITARPTGGSDSSRLAGEGPAYYTTVRREGIALRKPTQAKMSASICAEPQAGPKTHPQPPRLDLRQVACV